MIKEKASKRERLITKKYAFGRVLKDSKNLSKKKRIPKKYKFIILLYLVQFIIFLYNAFKINFVIIYYFNLIHFKYLYQCNINYFFKEILYLWTEVV
jgi:hypothetical protein